MDFITYLKRNALRHRKDLEWCRVCALPVLPEAGMVRLNYAQREALKAAEGGHDPGDAVCEDCARDFPTGAIIAEYADGKGERH